MVRARLSGEARHPGLGWTAHKTGRRIKSYSLVRAPSMRTTQQLSITLTKEMADAVKDKVRSGEYATESEVIRDGLRALLARDQAVEKWLRDTVVPAAEALRADPGQALTADEVREHLVKRRKAVAKHRT